MDFLANPILIENLQALGTRKITMDKRDTIPTFMELMSSGNPKFWLVLRLIQKSSSKVLKLLLNLTTSYHSGLRKGACIPKEKEQQGKSTEA